MTYLSVEGSRVTRAGVSAVCRIKQATLNATSFVIQLYHCC